MRVLWLTLRVPHPADSGELLYTRGLVESLAAAGAEVHGLCTGGTAPEPGTDRIQWHPATGPWRPRWPSVVDRLPSGAFRLATREMRLRLAALLREGKWNALVIDQAALGWGLSVWERAPQRPPLVYVSHNVESRVRSEFAARHGHGPRGWAMRWDAWKYARMERRLLQAARLVTAVTPEDAAVFNEEGEAREILVLSPGRWAPGPATGEAAPELSQRPRRVILSGSCEWVVKQHNMKRFLATALPVLQPAGIAVTVVGKMPEAFARELQAAFPAAEIHANVPDPSPFLDSARVGVIPEEAGGGFKLKALEYVFRGLPIAALPGTLAGLPLAEDDAVFAADLPALARRLAEVVDDPAGLVACAARARARCEGQFDWADRGRRLLTALASLSGVSQPVVASGSAADSSATSSTLMALP